VTPEDSDVLIYLGHYYGFTCEQIATMPARNVNVYLRGIPKLTGESGEDEASQKIGLSPSEMNVITGSAA
jgi:hypothetical protein